MKQVTLSILVDNSTGVLSRVAGLFSRRGYNIDSLTVGVTADPKYSRMTIVTSGDDAVIEQIFKQVKKLVEVRDIKILKPDKSVQRELMLVKVKASPAERVDIIAMVGTGSFRADVKDLDHDSLIVEVAGAGKKLEALLDLLSEYEILEVARTGITGLSRGIKDVRYLD